MDTESRKKLAIGWFSFTCCEDSTILLTELLNTHFDEWRSLVEFRYFKALKTDNQLENLDVAFIEGAVSAPKQEEEITKIRNNSKYVVAVGACAVTGMPSASRNSFTTKDIDEKIKFYMSQFDYSQKVKRLDEVIKVDDKVEGCPMSVEMFSEVLEKYLKLFNIV
jgi:coenzyme F420-reducing hydrogenase gamma subunit